MSTPESKLSGLGEFARLPMEVRVLIWKELFLESRPSNVYSSSKGWLSIIQASRQLSNEFTIELYHNRVLFSALLLILNRQIAGLALVGSRRFMFMISSDRCGAYVRVFTCPLTNKALGFQPGRGCHFRG